MREIKFRAWDLIRKKMVVPTIVDNPSFSELDTSTHKQQFILMQFTGLLDKNGNEIYEGDIIEWNVNFEGNEKSRMAIEINVSGGQMWSYPYINKTSKVIGNIYDTPELLK